MNNAILSPTDASKIYGVNVPDGMEAIYQPIYDFQVYPTAGFTSLTFFQTPVGGAGKTIRSTNLQAAGQLPSPQRFLLQQIEVHFYQGENPFQTDTAAQTGDQTNDVYNVLKEGSLVLTIGSKPYVTQAPLVTMPASNKFIAQFALDSTVAATSDTALYMAPAGPAYNMAAHKAPLWIPPNQNFDVNIAFDSAIAVTVAAKIGVRLCGILYRSKQ